MAEHDHSTCIETALNRAEALCQKRGSRFTAIRRDVLKLVWAEHKAVKAYDILEKLQRSDSARAKPPTVYRALDFLMEHGLVHKVESMNAYVGCPQPEEKHFSQFLICDRCSEISELSVSAASNALLAAADAKSFSVHSQTVEIHGICARCKN